jgi:hypothetical protein
MPGMQTLGPWDVHDEELPLLAATYGRAKVRMVAVGLRGGGLLVWSPGSRSHEARVALEKFGKVRFLLAPNHFHNAGLAEWMAECPGAVTVAHPMAHARLAKQVRSLGRIASIDELTPELPDGVRVFGPPMVKQGETWIGVDKGDLRALAVCDAITNMSEVPTFFWLLGFRARLMTNPFFKRLFLKSKSEYKEWLYAELAARPPNLFLPSHGTVVSGKDVAAELRRVTELA